MTTYLFFLLLLFFLISYLLLNLYNLYGLFWLLSDMSTPTPVSSLLHSLTIVSMGVYLKYKWNIEINTKIFIISLILSLFSFNFYDIKKLLALSTSYNISLVFLSSSIGIIHILNHGLFKSLLFLLSGYIIHDNIDLRLLSIHLNPYLYKLFLFLFIPLPFIFLSLSKDYIFLSSSFSLFLIFLLFNYFYFLMGKYFYLFFLNFPNFNYYLRSSLSLNSLPLLFSFSFFLLISINLPYNYNSYYLDLLPFLFMMNSNIYILNFLKHFENLLLRSYSSLFLSF